LRAAELPYDFHPIDPAREIDMFTLDTATSLVSFERRVFQPLNTSAAILRGVAVDVFRKGLQLTRRSASCAIWRPPIHAWQGQAGLLAGGITAALYTIHSP
jgi:hypothetical protein